MLKTLFLGGLFCFSLSVFVCFISWNLHEQVQNRKESIENQLAILKDGHFKVHGYPLRFPAWQNRILIPQFFINYKKSNILLLNNGI